MYLKTKHVDRERKEEIFRPQILFCKHVFNKSCDRTKTKRYIHVRSLFALIDDKYFAYRWQTLAYLFNALILEHFVINMTKLLDILSKCLQVVCLQPV